MTFTLSSPVFESGQAIPERYTCDGGNMSPPLAWEHVPEGTQSLALVVEDPDAPLTTWVHWVIFNIPPEKNGLPENMPGAATWEGGTRHGKNSWGKLGYGGPCPPGKKTHRYCFTAYALDATLHLEPGVKKKHLLKAMAGHLLAEATLMGTYGRKYRQ
jgi:hypothetical protein